MIHLGLVRGAARRHSRAAGTDLEDLVQTGIIGLIKAVDRYDLSRNTPFATFAFIYVEGEIKRHFRDVSWAVHVPRAVKERAIAVAQAADLLACLLNRLPSIREISDYLHLKEAAVRDAFVAANGYRTRSLDSSEADLPARWIARTEPGYLTVEDLAAVAQLLAALDDRERQIIDLRFGHGLTQEQIGARLGITQSHVSRLLDRSLGKMKSRA